MCPWPHLPSPQGKRETEGDPRGVGWGWEMVNGVIEGPGVAKCLSVAEGPGTAKGPEVAVGPGGVLGGLPRVPECSWGG